MEHFYGIHDIQSELWWHYIASIPTWSDNMITICTYESALDFMAGMIKPHVIEPIGVRLVMSDEINLFTKCMTGPLSHIDINLVELDFTDVIIEFPKL